MAKRFNLPVSISILWVIRGWFEGDSGVSRQWHRAAASQGAPLPSNEGSWVVCSPETCYLDFRTNFFDALLFYYLVQSFSKDKLGNFLYKVNNLLKLNIKLPWQVSWAKVWAEISLCTLESPSHRGSHIRNSSAFTELC